MKLMCFCLVAGLALPCLAQISPEPPVSTADEVSAKLAGQPLFLRGFWSDDKLAFDAAGQPVGVYFVSSFTLAGFEETSVRIEGQTLIVEGKRVGIIFDAKGNPQRVPLHGSGFLSKSEKVVVRVDSDKTGDFSPALQAVFANGLKEIAPTLPEAWEGYVRNRLGGEDVFKEGREASVVHVGRPSEGPNRVMPPKLIKAYDPIFSEESRRMKFSGTSQIYCWVEKDGHPNHIRIAHPAGLGLDEKAVDAVSRYVFKPATKDGEPVAVDLYVDVSFTIF